MKRLMLAIWLCVGFAGLAAAEGTNLPVKIGAAGADQHYDRLMTVTGTVAQVTLRPTIVFINLDHKGVLILIYCRALVTFGHGAKTAGGISGGGLSSTFA